MNKLIEEVCRILDFPLDKSELAFKEAFSSSSPKLYGTHMFVNGELTYLEAVDWHNGILLDEHGKQHQVKTLEPWLPETGIYTDGKYYVYIYKKTHKHWQKSYKHSNYGMVFLNDTPDFDLKKIAKSKPESIVVINGTIFYGRHIVGFNDVGGDTICNNPLLYQELVDYSNRRNLGWNVKL